MNADNQDNFANEQPRNLIQFNPEICNLKHKAIDDKLQNIKETEDQRHEELKKIVSSMKEEIKKDLESNHQKLKDKVVLTKNSLGEKIDALNEFNDTLRGNGDPGIWQSVRWIKWEIRILIATVVITLVLLLGGNFRGITLEKIKNIFSSQNTNTTEVQNNPPLVAPKDANL